ncbi:hypothetical protein D3C80_1626500 [compost metagenome]
MKGECFTCLNNDLMRRNFIRRQTGRHIDGINRTRCFVRPFDGIFQFIERSFIRTDSQECINHNGVFIPFRIRFRIPDQHIVFNQFVLNPAIFTHLTKRNEVAAYRNWQQLEISEQNKSVSSVISRSTKQNNGISRF